MKSVCDFSIVKAFPRAVKPEEVWLLVWLGARRKANRKALCEEEIVCFPGPVHETIFFFISCLQNLEKKKGKKVEKVWSRNIR